MRDPKHPAADEPTDQELMQAESACSNFDKEVYASCLYVLKDMLQNLSANPCLEDEEIRHETSLEDQLSALEVQIAEIRARFPDLTPKKLSLAVQLRLARQKAGWSQKELAQKSGVHEQTISRIELGNKKPDTTTLYNLLIALGLPSFILHNDTL